MRILLIADSYFPSVNSCAKLMRDLAVELVSKNHYVTVVVPDSMLKVDRRYNEEEGVNILRIRSGSIKGVNRLTRAVNESRLSVVIWKSCKDLFREKVHDYVIFYSPSIFFGPLVKKLKKLWHCKSYLIIRDIFPQWAVDAGILRKGLVYLYFKYKEIQQYNAADVIGIESPGYYPYFLRQKIKQDKRIEVLYNWTDLNKRRIYSDDRIRLGLENKFVFFYGGNIGAAQEMGNIVQLARDLRENTNIHILLVGDGSEAGRLKEVITTEKLTNITIHPPVPQERYLQMLSQFDAGLISLNRKLQAHNFPSKLLGYMYFAKPTLGSINPGNDLKDILENNHAGLVCISGEHEQLRDHAIRLASDRYLCMKMGLNGRRLLEEKFSSAGAVSQIVSHINFPAVSCQKMDQHRDIEMVQTKYAEYK